MSTVQDIQFKEPAARAAEALRAAAPSDELQDMQGEKMVLNMGPSHPSTHGVLRIILEMDGEIITKAIPDVGYLHRGDEKIAENMTYTQFIPYTTLFRSIQFKEPAARAAEALRAAAPSDELQDMQIGRAHV